jgi:cell division protein FtsA
MDPVWFMQITLPRHSLSACNSVFFSHTAGSHITADLARHFRILPTDAEQLKLAYGGCSAKRGELIPHSSRRIYRDDFVNVITARIEEIITEAANHTRRSRHGGRLVAGLVITGGTAQLPELDYFIEQMTNTLVRIGSPSEYQGLSDMVDTPVHATGVGLVMHREAVPDQRQNNQEKPSKGLVSWLKNLF